MSFIYQDKSLIEQLTSSAVKHLEKFGQNLDLANYELANKLVVDLQRQIDPDNAPAVQAPIGTPNDQNIELTDRNLRNVGDFINWIAQNQLTWNGKRFAWTKDEFEANPQSIPDEAGEFSAYTIDRQRDTESRQPRQVSAYALKPELLAFVTHLRDSEENRKNRVLQVMIGKLISQINDNLADDERKLETRPSATATPVTMNQDIVIDGLPAVLKYSNPTEGIDNWGNGFPNSNQKVTPRLLNNPSQFRSFILQQNVQDETGATSQIGNSANKNPCLGINILYRRAQYLVNTVGQANDENVPNYSAAAKLYLDKIVEIGKTFTGPDGKPCSVVAPGTTVVTPTGTTDGTPGTTGRLSVEQVRALDNLLSNLPLEMNSINFIKIQQFMRAYAQFDTSVGGADMAIQSMAKALRIIDLLQHQIMNNAYPYINLAQSAQMASHYVKGGYNGMMVFCDNLRQLVATTSSVVGALYGTYGRIIDQVPAKKSLVKQQLEQYTRDNAEAIGTWADAVQQVLHRR